MPSGGGVTIEVEGLTRRFGEREVVSDVSFAVRPGRITGFLGPNGAGKTTTLRVLLGLLEPSAGTATFDGRRYRDIPHPMTVVGASLEGNALVRSRRGIDHLRAYAAPAMASRTRADELLRTVGLAADARRSAGGYSLGMQQRLMLATAMLGDPSVLILDEPANGLDPAGVFWLRSLLQGFATSGRTVLLSSHMLAEMELVADDVVLIDGGRVVYEGTLDDLLGGERSVVTTSGSPEAYRLLQSAIRDRCDVEEAPGGRFVVGAPVPSVHAWTAGLIEEHPRLAGTFSVDRMGLEAAFLARVAPHEEAYQQEASR